VSVLHITNGDSAADTLRVVLAAPVLVVADVLHEGPCPRVNGDAWHDVRAQFLTGYGADREQTRTGFAASDRAIADALAREERIVLWFEHDLFDQLLLIRVLDLIVRLIPDTTGETAPAETVTAVVSGFSRTWPRVSLICIDRFPGVDRFIGLGQLVASQLSTLVGTGVDVDRKHYAIASSAWNAFRSPDPRELFALTERLRADAEAARRLPFLRDALLRFLAEYPSTVNGLSRTELLALETLAGRTTTAGELFRATQERERCPFLGDLPFFETLRALATGRVPLVTLTPGAAADDPGAQRLALTDAGRLVVEGRADRIALDGIDCWRGGVHLAGEDRCPWRWDARTETLVS
jgi:hypothetical protein